MAVLEILAETELNKKGQGIIDLERGNMLVYSGVKEKCKAVDWVECIIKMDLVKKVTKWEYISEIVSIVELDIENGTNTSIVILYAPNEDETVSKVDVFWYKLPGITEILYGEFLLGDVKGRTRKGNGTNKVLGMQAEDFRKKKRQLMLHLCIKNKMIIANTVSSTNRQKK